MKLYRYNVIGAFLAGVKEHPETDIKRVAPNATELEPHMIADCWLFKSPPIADLPDYIDEVE